MKLQDTILDVEEEVAKAMANWPEFHTPHEGYAILLEEVDELWDLVKVNQNKYDLAAMRKEAIQVAAMAVRFAHELCNPSKGNK